MSEGSSTQTHDSKEQTSPRPKPFTRHTKPGRISTPEKPLVSTGLLVVDIQTLYLIMEPTPVTLRQG